MGAVAQGALEKHAGRAPRSFPLARRRHASHAGTAKEWTDDKNDCTMDGSPARISRPGLGSRPGRGRPGEDIGECLGFKVSYKPVTFAALPTTLASGQADFVMSDIYATKERAKAGDFITYSKVFDGVLVARGNPKGIKGIDLSWRGAAAENTGYVEAPLMGDLAEPCKKAGKAGPMIQLCDNNADCIQAILAGRADNYVNDINSVEQAVKANPDKLEKAATSATAICSGRSGPPSACREKCGSASSRWRP